MNALLREIGFMWRQRANLIALCLLAALASLAVGLGLQEVAKQRADIAQVLELEKTEDAAIKVFAKEAGEAAYYRFHTTWDAPSPLAFAALGQRDVTPTILRVRALAIEGQIYENEALNPEIALPGRFDFAFVLIYLAPLVIITLLHDLWSGEKDNGRLAWLQSMPQARTQVWLPRILARFAIVCGALLVPLWIGALISGASVNDIAAVTALVLCLVGFWTGLTILAASRHWSTPTNAAALAAIWFAITLIAPASANIVINATTPIPQGADIMRENREAVHDAWDLDRNATLARFYKLYPQWATSPPMTKPFDWKWYFAFQHLGDVHVEDTSSTYRKGIKTREDKASKISLFLPPIAIQRSLHAIAKTDTAAQFAYQNRVRAYHTKLRTFYYPFLFAAEPFSEGDFDNVPRFID